MLKRYPPITTCRLFPTLRSFYILILPPPLMRLTPSTSTLSMNTRFLVQSQFFSTNFFHRWFVETSALFQVVRESNQDQPSVLPYKDLSFSCRAFPSPSLPLSVISVSPQVVGPLPPFSYRQSQTLRADRRGPPMSFPFTLSFYILYPPAWERSDFPTPSKTEPIFG